MRLFISLLIIIWLGSARRLSNCSSDPLVTDGISISPSNQVRDLGVLVSSDLSMVVYVNKITSTCYYHMRQLRSIRRSLSIDTAKSLVHALIHSRLDYCNGVLASLPQFMCKQLQSVLRASARLVLRLPTSASLRDQMKDTLHWLPFPERELFTNCVRLLLSASTTWPRRTSPNCAFHSLKSRVAPTFDPPSLVIWPSREL